MTFKRFGISRKTNVANAIDSDKVKKSEDEKAASITKHKANVNAQPPVASRPSSDPVADDLVRRVIQAIDGWIIDNGLEKLPRQIAFQQALSILNALDRTYSGKDRK